MVNPEGPTFLLSIMDFTQVICRYLICRYMMLFLVTIITRPFLDLESWNFVWWTLRDKPFCWVSLSSSGIESFTPWWTGPLRSLYCPTFTVGLVFNDLFHQLCLVYNNTPDKYHDMIIVDKIIMIDMQTMKKLLGDYGQIQQHHHPMSGIILICNIKKLWCWNTWVRRYLKIQSFIGN